MTSGIGGHPGTLITGLSRITWCTGVARVGGEEAAPADVLCAETDKE